MRLVKSNPVLAAQGYAFFHIEFWRRARRVRYRFAGVCVVECPAIPGCVSQGRTEAEALENIKDAIRQCLEVRADRGMPLTVATHEIDIHVG